MAAGCGRVGWSNNRAVPVRRVDLNDYSLDLAAAADEAAGELAAGRLIVLPTETVYGIAAKPNEAAAAEAINGLRGDRAASPLTPLTPHLASAEELPQFVGNPGPLARRLTSKLWPGPVAIVFTVADAEKQRAAAERLGVEASVLYAADGRITLRCPDDSFAEAVLARAGQPAVLTRLGLPTGSQATRPPTDADLADLPVSAVYDGGPTRYARPSTVVRIEPDGESWSVVREGIYDRRILERLLRKTLLFVCSGNTCRSPMAMAIGRDVLARRLGTTPDNLGEKGYEVASAGSYAMPGMRATGAAVDAVADLGGGLASHRSSPLDVAGIHRADLIVTMGQSHREAVLAMVPSAAKKTVMLDPDGDVEDPIGSSAAHYRQLADRMRGLVEARVPTGFTNDNGRGDEQPMSP